jgi:hypothetical protein
MKISVGCASVTEGGIAPFIECIPLNYMYEK